MHTDQVDLAAGVVAGIVAAQFPRWSGREVRPVASDGTVNALFRLGDDVVLRFPLRPRADDAMRESLAREQDDARRIGARVAVQVPEPLALGEPADGYPGWWAAYRWIAGEVVTAGNVADPVLFAVDLAGFVRDLHAMDTDGRGWDGRSRGGPLDVMSDRVERALAQSAGLVDV